MWRARLDPGYSDADRASFQMAFPHHGAAQDNQRRRADSEFIRTQQRSHDDVTSRSDLSIRLFVKYSNEMIEYIFRLLQPRLVPMATQRF